MFDVPCGGADVLRVIKFVWILLDIVLLVVPIGLILMIVLDFGKNVIAGREDEMKKGLGVAIKRIIFCVCLFLVQPFCEFVIEFVNGPDTDTENPGALQCLEIAINEDDFSAYEIDYDEINNNNNNNTSNGTTDNEDNSDNVSNGTNSGSTNTEDNKNESNNNENKKDEFDFSKYKFKDSKIEKAVKNGENILIGISEKLYINNAETEIKKLVYDSVSGKYYVNKINFLNGESYTVEQLANAEIKSNFQ